jgi:hypothetical protein
MCIYTRSAWLLDRDSSAVVLLLRWGAGLRFRAMPVKKGVLKEFGLTCLRRWLLEVFPYGIVPAGTGVDRRSSHGSKR